MEVTHAKGLMYPALQLSSFRVRRDSLPPTFALPHEVASAVQEPLPEVRSGKLEQKALQQNQKLIEESEREQKATLAMIAREEALRKQEKAQEDKEKEDKERASAKATADKSRMVEEFMNITGEMDRAAAEARLERCGWDLQKAAQSFFGD